MRQASIRKAFIGDRELAQIGYPHPSADIINRVKLSSDELHILDNIERQIGGQNFKQAQALAQNLQNKTANRTLKNLLDRNITFLRRKQSLSNKESSTAPKPISKPASKARFPERTKGKPPVPEKPKPLSKPKPLAQKPLPKDETDPLAKKKPLGKKKDNIGPLDQSKALEDIKRQLGHRALMDDQDIDKIKEIVGALSLFLPQLIAGMSPVLEDIQEKLQKKAEKEEKEEKEAKKHEMAEAEKKLDRVLGSLEHIQRQGVQLQLPPPGEKLEGFSENNPLSGSDSPDPSGGSGGSGIGGSIGLPETIASGDAHHEQASPDSAIKTMANLVVQGQGGAYDPTNQDEKPPKEYLGKKRDQETDGEGILGRKRRPDESGSPTSSADAMPTVGIDQKSGFDGATTGAPSGGPGGFSGGQSGGSGLSTSYPPQIESGGLSSQISAEEGVSEPVAETSSLEQSPYQPITHELPQESDEPRVIQGVLRMEKEEESPYIKLTYDFNRLPHDHLLSQDNQIFEYAYYKYKPLLEKAWEFVRRRQLKKALNYYRTIADQPIPKELRRMILINIKDINQHMEKFIRSDFQVRYFRSSNERQIVQSDG